MGDKGPKKWEKRKKIIWIATGSLLLIILIALCFFGYHRLSVIIRQSQLRTAYVESTELIPEEIQMPQEVIINEWNLARIIIPAIDVDLIVLGGVDVFDPFYLDQGPVHFQMKDMPNTESGNVAIAGHRGGKWRFFFDLDQLEEGNEIILDIEGYRFIYHVQWQKVTDKYDWIHLEPTDSPALTLQTCEPKNIKGPDASLRLFIRADLYEVTRTPELD